MAVAELDTPLVEGGIDNVNFFNGRILSAEDLRQLQAADRHHRARLGQALGPGVAGGLRVSRAPSGAPGIVAVSAGIAVNRLGELAVLGADAEVRVIGAPPAATRSDSTLFAECGQSDSAPIANLEFAAMLLTVRPDSQSRGTAPAIDPLGRGLSCGPGVAREGVRFRRVAIDLQRLFTASGATAVLRLTTPEDRAQARSVLAHLHLGSPWLPPLLTDTFDATDRTRIAFEALDDCEVPLALFVIRNGEVALLDEWAARRRLARPADTDDTAFLVEPRRRRVGEATLLQFQSQLAEELERAKNLVLRQLFLYLPAAGLLPALTELLGSRALATLAAGNLPCFAGIAHTVVDEELSPALVEHAIRVGSEMAPIDLTGARPVPRVLVFGVSDPAPAPPLEQVLFVRADHPLGERHRRRVIEKEIVALDRRLDALEQAEQPTVTLLYRGPESPVLTPGDPITLPFDLLASDAGTFKLAAAAENPSAFQTFFSLVSAEIVGATEVPVTPGVAVRVRVKVSAEERKVVGTIEADEIFKGTLVFGEENIDLGDLTGPPRTGGGGVGPGPIPFEREASRAAGEAGGGFGMFISSSASRSGRGEIKYFRQYTVTLDAQSSAGPALAATKRVVVTIS